ncbi:hypothetical protein DID88_008950 [Monilinia fructigena]|uniref:Uncharacterized protein n=1 Tax=Monilinia fructigena TaxID=38457 RepID=A0A395J722_9HELO|nr:hypothetical protein DID88_008950 [Monilinia fructigena]
MGMSVMSDTTTVTLEDGKKVKKKRKYEERRRRQDPDPYFEPRQHRQFLDGKRLPPPQREQLYGGRV